MDAKQHYLSYLLRLWKAGSGTEPVWRASLQSPGTGELRGFPSLEALVSFLRRQTGSTPGGDGVEEDSDGRSERRRG
jgi:hypothetical protein